MKKNLFSAFLQTFKTTYSHIEPSVHLNRMDNEIYETLIKNEDFTFLLYGLNNHVTLNEVIEKLCELESNIIVLNLALKNSEDENNQHIKKLNEMNLQLIKQLFTMLENKELTYENK